MKIVAAERPDVVQSPCHAISRSVIVINHTHICSKEGHARLSFDTRCNFTSSNMSLALWMCIYCVASQKQSGKAHRAGTRLCSCTVWCRAGEQRSALRSQEHLWIQADGLFTHLGR